MNKEKTQIANTRRKEEISLRHPKTQRIRENNKQLNGYKSDNLDEMEHIPSKIQAQKTFSGRYR